MPKCLYSNYDEKTANYLIILKDESEEYQPLDQLKQYNLQENLNIVKNISKMHSKFFNKSIEELPSWMPSSLGNLSTTNFLFKQMLKKFPSKCEEFKISEKVSNLCTETIKKHFFDYYQNVNKIIPRSINHM